MGLVSLPMRLLSFAGLLLTGDAQGMPMAADAVPPGLRDWLGKDLCGSPPWVDFHAGLSEVVKHFNALDFASALSTSVKLLEPKVRDPYVAFDCATAVSSTLVLAAQSCEQLQLPVLSARFRQLGAIFGSFDYQMKGEEYLDQSPWPIQWMDAMEGILRSMTFLKGHEQQVEPFRSDPSRLFLAEHAPVHQGGVKPRVAIVSVCDYDAGTTPLARLSDINKQSYAQRHGYEVFMYEKAPVFQDPLSALLTEPPTHRPAAWSKVDALLTTLAAGQHDWVMWMDCDSFFMDPDVQLTDFIAVAERQHAFKSADTREHDDLKELQKLLDPWMRGPSSATSDGEALLQWYDGLFAKHYDGSQKSGSQQGPTNRTLGWDTWLYEERRPHLLASEDGLMLNTGIMLVRASVWSWQFFQKVRTMTFGKSPVTQHPWWEQTAMVYLLQLPFTLSHAAQQSARSLEDIGPSSGRHLGFAPACVMLSQRHFNAYPPIVASALRTHYAFDSGDFIVSFSGCKVYSSQEVCNQLFLSYFFQVHDPQTFAADFVLSSWM